MDIIELSLQHYRSKRAAIKDFGIVPPVIEKFGDKITVEDFLRRIRVSLLGPKDARRIHPSRDSVIAREMVLKVAGDYLRSAPAGQDTLLGHSDERVRRFAKRMYVSLNPDGYSPDKLQGLREGWDV